MTVLEPLMPLVNVTNLCGSSILSTNASGILLWSNGASTSSINVYTAGTYTVTQSVSGCLSPAGSATAAPIIPVPVYVTLNGATLTSSASSGNQWYEVLLGMLNGATGQTYVPIQNGNYYSVVTDNNGCLINSDTINVLTTGIETNSLVDNVKIYPNPSTGIFNIALDKIGTSCTIRIVNIIGAKIYEETLEKPDGMIRSVDLTKYSNGLYFIDIITQSNELKSKIVINK
jgi:hypothetical protein